MIYGQNEILHCQISSRCDSIYVVNLASNMDKRPSVSPIRRAQMVLLRVKVYSGRGITVKVTVGQTPLS